LSPNETVMQVSAYGRELQIVRGGERWTVYDLGSESKRRKAADIKIPSDVAVDEIVQYLSDLLHEYATPRDPDVYLLTPRRISTE
jgi:hypothetical protein